MDKNEIFKDGKLLEYTTKEIIDNIVYFKHYDGESNLLDEWTEDAPIPSPPTEKELMQEKLDAQDEAIMELAELLSGVMMNG